MKKVKIPEDNFWKMTVCFRCEVRTKVIQLDKKELDKDDQRILRNNPKAKMTIRECPKCKERNTIIEY